MDLGAARSISRVVLRLPAGWGACTQTLSLQAGADGSTFTTVKAAAAYAFDPAADNTVTLTLPATVQRWFRLTVTANSGWPTGQLSEFEVRSS
ncbi:discoidin domain-containing protein [Streptomyces sp. LN704]|uniref:discoidin domain-containing protein n=1 Tax=Streptomyces sp. LN704 TaxID=3112982 RepID=UPI003716108B